VQVPVSIKHLKNEFEMALDEEVKARVKVRDHDIQRQLAAFLHAALVYFVDDRRLGRSDVGRMML
jgi:hypothetical protein